MQLDSDSTGFTSKIYYTLWTIFNLIVIAYIFLIFCIVTLSFMGINVEVLKSWSLDLDPSFSWCIFPSILSAKLLKKDYVKTIRFNDHSFHKNPKTTCEDEISTLENITLIATGVISNDPLDFIKVISRHLTYRLKT